MDLSNRLLKISEPQTIKMAKLSRALKAEGKDVIDLSLGEPDFDTPTFIKDAAIEAIQQGFTKYPPVIGYPELRAAIVAKFQQDNQLTYTTEQVMVSNGAKQCIANIFLSILNEGDEVIIPTPYWVTYGDIVKMSGGNVVEVYGPIEQDFKISAAQLENVITNKTKALIFSSPCNPTGSIYTREELTAIAEVLRKHPNIIIISDEIYEYINFEGEHHSIAQQNGMQERTIIVNGLSKAYAMTGWRLGYMAGPAEIIKACENIQSQTTSGVNSMTQRAAIVALGAGKNSAETMVQAFKERRDFLVSALNSIPGVVCKNPTGAFYVFPDISHYLGKTFNGEKLDTALSLCLYLLNEGLVSMVTGDAFGSANCVRISYAAGLDKLKEAIARISKALNQLQ